MYSAPAATEHLVHAKLSALIEPNDYVSGALLNLIEPRQLLSLIEREDWHPRDLEMRVHEELGTSGSSNSEISFTAGLRRWRKRLPYAGQAAQLLQTMQRMGGGILLPGDPHWPMQLHDLGLGRPLCLWWRSTDPARLAGQELGRNVAVVGSRDSSDYGNQATTELVQGLRQAGICIISGGAYGIDACAHRAALLTEDTQHPAPPTIAILAGGLDKLYPAGNAKLLDHIIDAGLLLSEVPPGTPPTRFRFLNRNRLIAALCQLTVVTEARFRSGALNTARQAVDLGREVGAMPGSVFSPNSVGAHRLIRESTAGLITNVQDALAMLPHIEGPEADCGNLQQGPTRSADGLNQAEAMMLDVLSRRGAKVVDELCALSGLGAIHALRALNVLQGRGQAAQEGSGWKRIGN